MLVNVAVSWSVSRKYMTSIGSHFLRLVRQFVIAVSDSRDTLTEALLAKARKLAAKNQPATAKALAGFNRSLETMVEFVNSKALFGEAGFPPHELARLRSLIAPDARHDSAVCTLTGVPIQSWASGDGIERYYCLDASGVCHTKEIHEAISIVREKIVSLRKYPGLQEQCLDAMKQLDPYVSEYWVLETDIASRVRTVLIGAARTPAEVLRYSDFPRPACFSCS